VVQKGEENEKESFFFSKFLFFSIAKKLSHLEHGSIDSSLHAMRAPQPSEMRLR